MTAATLLPLAAALYTLYLAVTGSYRAYRLRDDAERQSLLAGTYPQEDYASRAHAYTSAASAHAAAGEAFLHAAHCWAVTVTLLLLRDLVTR